LEDVELITESAKAECDRGECLEEDLVPLRLESLVDVDKDLSANTGSRDNERLAREFERLLAASDKDLISPGPPETVELGIASLGYNAKRSVD
jgi:hypothetical protein